MFAEPEFWVAVAFIILMGVFAYFGVHRTVIKTLDNRSDRIKAELDDARRLKEEAASLLAQYKARHASAEREAQDIIAGAQAEAERIAAEAKTKLEDFVALYLISSRIALPGVRSLLDERQNKIDGDLTEAQKLKDASDGTLKAYESELAAARARAQAISAETRDKLNAAADAERKKLEEQLAVKLAAAEKTIASTREAAMSNVHGIASDTAAAIVQRLIGVLPDGGSISNAVDASLKGQA